MLVRLKNQDFFFTFSFGLLTFMLNVLTGVLFTLISVYSSTTLLEFILKKINNVEIDFVAYNFLLVWIILSGTIIPVVINHKVNSLLAKKRFGNLPITPLFRLSIPYLAVIGSTSLAIGVHFHFFPIIF